MDLNIGDIFYFDVAYEDNPNVIKNRPVIIIDEDENNILLLISTTTKPRNTPLRSYDKHKVPIQNWRRTGLPKASWAKANYLIKLKRQDVESIVQQSDYIGRMHDEDFNNLIEKIDKIHK